MRAYKFTTVTQLHAENNKQIIDYIENSISTYAKAIRGTFQHIKHRGIIDTSGYNTYLQSTYGITKRTANSIIKEAQGRYNSLLELKQYEKTQLERKIKWFESVVIPKLQEQKNHNCTKLRDGVLIDLTSHRNLKRKLVAKKNKLNRMKQKLNNITYQIQSGVLKLCFGTKQLLNSNYQKFIAKRDSQMSFIGAKAETSCNQMLQLTYNPKNNQFNIKLRKDFNYKTAKGNDRYAFGKVYFNHHKKELIYILEQKTSPLTYKIIKRNNRYYLYCTFELQKEIATSKINGVFGLDFNKSFVTVIETNKYGHMINNWLLRYRFRQGNKTVTDLQQIANRVTTLALATGKSIVIENLNFDKTKAETETKRGRKYNEMLHSLAYRKFISLLDYKTYKNNIHLIKVDPAWTSWIAKHKYCPSMKLNTHIGASYVIARRGQGYLDKVA